MQLFQKQEARAAAGRYRAQAGRSFKTADRILREETSNVFSHERFDVFLSHASTDAELILGVKVLLEEQGLKVYVDWITDAQLDRSHVTPETADLLRRRMRQSKSLIFVATNAASQSKWMPWELGFFDGYRPDHVAILPLVDNPQERFQGQEYLALYPIAFPHRIGSYLSDVVVGNDRQAKYLKSFAA